ncbi:MAG: hypothetical protein IJ637_08070, partial [Prevotella sp.]|nr:hypothetical protein [Prevotella sp.]
YEINWRRKKILCANKNNICARKRNICANKSDDWPRATVLAKNGIAFSGEEWHKKGPPVAQMRSSGGQFR